MTTVGWTGSRSSDTRAWSGWLWIGRRIPAIAAIADRHRIQVCNVFHAGDGNLHPLICYDERAPGQAEQAEAVAAEILAYCIDAGGSLTGEHGIGADKAAHHAQLLQQHRVRRWVVAVERDQLRDVHALVAHPLDRADHVQQRGGEPQVAGHGRLQRGHGDEAFVVLVVERVDLVVARDDVARERDVAALERREHASQLRACEVEPVEGERLQVRQLFGEAGAQRGRLVRSVVGHPTLPVT